MMADEKLGPGRTDFDPVEQDAFGPGHYMTGAENHDPGPPVCEHDWEHEDCTAPCSLCKHPCSEHYPLGDPCDADNCNCKKFEDPTMYAIHSAIAALSAAEDSLMAMVRHGDETSGHTHACRARANMCREAKALLDNAIVEAME